MKQSVESLIKRAKCYFNRKEYEQFIHPLINTLEEMNRHTIKQEILNKVANIFISSMSKIKDGVETIENEEYVKLSVVEDAIKSEIQTYS